MNITLSINEKNFTCEPNKIITFDIENLYDGIDYTLNLPFWVVANNVFSVIKLSDVMPILSLFTAAMPFLALFTAAMPPGSSSLKRCPSWPS